MSKQKKNTGCKDCKYYEQGTSNGGVGYWTTTYLCHNKSLLTPTVKFCPVEGEYTITDTVDPLKKNKNLTCKGFTPIDWKAKYEVERLEAFEASKRITELESELVDLKTGRKQPLMLKVDNANIESSFSLTWAYVGVGFISILSIIWAITKEYCN